MGRESAHHPLDILVGQPALLRLDGDLLTLTRPLLIRRHLRAKFQNKRERSGTRWCGTRSPRSWAGRVRVEAGCGAFSLTGAAAGGLPQPIHAAAPKSNKHKPSRTVLAASTCSMPLASTLNVTSICGIPRGIGGIPFRSNLPRMLLSFVNRRSPSYTCHVAANQGMRQSINQQSIKQQNQLPRTPGWLWLCSRLARGAGSGGHARRPGCSHQAGCRRTSRMSATCAQVSSCHVESGWSSDRPPFRCRGRADLHRVGVGPLCPPTPRPTAHPPNE